MPNGRFTRAVTDGTLAGLAGTAAMSVLMAAELKLVDSGGRVVDYDASDHVVVAASKVLRRRPRSRVGRQLLFQCVHWGYGSLVGTARVALGEVASPVAADALFFAGSQAMALSLFPLLGDTPAPWRWRAQPLVSSFVLHGVYAAVTGLVVRRRRS